MEPDGEIIPTLHLKIDLADNINHGSGLEFCRITIGSSNSIKSHMYKTNRLLEQSKYSQGIEYHQPLLATHILLQFTKTLKVTVALTTKN